MLLFLQHVIIFDHILNAAHDLSVHIVLFNLLVFSEVAVRWAVRATVYTNATKKIKRNACPAAGGRGELCEEGMCHVYFMSTAMDSWSGFRVHTVIFHHVSVPQNSQTSVCIQKQCGLSCHCVFLQLCVWVRRGTRDKTASLVKQQQNQTYRDREEEGVEKSERERERMNEEKAYYQKTDGPQFTAAPQGPGGTTLCTSGLPA